jgi:hypothetical protein
MQLISCDTQVYFLSDTHCDTRLAVGLSIEILIPAIAPVLKSGCVELLLPIRDPVPRLEDRDFPLISPLFQAAFAADFVDDEEPFPF